MKRCYSLKKNKDFQFTYRVGKSVGNKLFAIVYVHDRRKKKASRHKEQQLCTPCVRVGFSASKKVGNSVMRNRAKRRLRAAFAPYLPQIRHNHNLIIIARKPVLDCTFVSLSAAMGQQLARAGLLLEEHA